MIIARNVEYDPKKNGKLISSYEEVIKLVGALRILGKVIVFISGTFDLTHIGHCRYFRCAIDIAAEHTGRPREDIVLIVALDNDMEVKSRKGKFRPIVNDGERAEFLEYLEDTTYVVIKTEEEQSWALAELLKPDFMVISKSTEFINVASEDAMLKHLETIAENIIVLPPQATTSTTAKIRLLITETVVDIKKRFDVIVDEFRSFLEKVAGGGGV